MADHAISPNQMAVREAKMERYRRSSDDRNEAFNGGFVRREIEQAAIASVSARFAPSAQNAAILQPVA